jgi:hypothetical protein
MALKEIKKAMGSSVYPWLIFACFGRDSGSSRLRANASIAAKIIIIALLPCLIQNHILSHLCYIHNLIILKSLEAMLSKFIFVKKKNSIFSFSG